MRDYTLQMNLVGYLHSSILRYTSRCTRRAGAALVSPDGCASTSGRLGNRHAERIGHGVDVMVEDSAENLLKEMATRHIVVEINLTSNAFILVSRR